MLLSAPEFIMVFGNSSVPEVEKSDQPLPVSKKNVGNGVKFEVNRE